MDNTAHPNIANTALTTKHNSTAEQQFHDYRDVCVFECVCVCVCVLCVCLSVSVYLLCSVGYMHVVHLLQATPRTMLARPSTLWRGPLSG